MINSMPEQENLEGSCETPFCAKVEKIDQWVAYKDLVLHLYWNRFVCLFVYIQEWVWAHISYEGLSLVYWEIDEGSLGIKVSEM